MTEIKSDRLSVTNEDVKAALRAYVAGLTSDLPEMPEPNMVRAWVVPAGYVTVLRSHLADESFPDRKTIEAWLTERGFVLHTWHDLGPDDSVMGRAILESWRPASDLAPKTLAELPYTSDDKSVYPNAPRP